MLSVQVAWSAPIKIDWLAGVVYVAASTGWPGTGNSCKLKGRRGGEEERRRGGEEERRRGGEVEGGRRKEEGGRKGNSLEGEFSNEAHKVYVVSNCVV